MFPCPTRHSVSVSNEPRTGVRAGHEGEVVDRLGDAVAIAKGLVYRQRLPVLLIGGFVVPLVVGDAARSEVRLCQRRRFVRAERGDQPFEPVSCHREVAPLLPEPPYRCSSVSPPLRFSCVERPLEGGLEVVVLVLEPVEPLDLVVRREMRLTSAGQRKKVAGVAPPGPCLVAPGAKPLFGELPNGLEHAEPWLATWQVGPADQAVVDQGGQCIESVDTEVTTGVADSFDGVDVGAATEHRQPGEQSLLRLGQQSIAPVDGCPQGPLS
jgi:hypothetical protein